MEVLEMVKKEINISDHVTKCMGCGDGVLEIVKNDKDVNILLCSGCGCKHSIEDGRVTYEYVYKDLAMDDEDVKWNISDN